MINLSTLVNRITGKSGAAPATAPDGGAANEQGLATSGDFAALVQLAKQSAAGEQPGLRLVIDNSGKPKEAPLVQLTDRDIAKLLQQDTTAPAASTPPQKSVDLAQAIVALVAEAPESADQGSSVSDSTDGGEVTDGKAEPNAATQVAPPGLNAAAIMVVNMPAEVSRGAHAPQAKGDVMADQLELTSRTAGLEIASLPALPTESDAGDGAATANPAADSVESTFTRIMDALPPVIQSSITASGVRASVGPSTGAMLGDQVIDMGVSGQWLDRMANEIASMAEGSGHSRFSLSPPHLGRLQVDLFRDQDMTSVRILAETDEAVRRLADGRSALQNDARLVALQLGSITVEKSSAAFEAGRDQGQSQSQFTGRGSDLSGQAQQQSQGGQAQGRASGQQGEWVSRITREQENQSGDTPSVTTTESSVNGRIRFA